MRTVLAVVGTLYAVLGLIVAAVYEYSLVTYREQLAGVGVHMPTVGRRIWHFLQRVILWPLMVWSTLAATKAAGERSRQVRRAQDRAVVRPKRGKR